MLNYQKSQRVNKEEGVGSENESESCKNIYNY